MHAARTADVFLSVGTSTLVEPAASLPFIALQVTGRSPLRSTGLDQPAKGLAAGFLLGVLNYAAWAVPLMWAAERFFPAELVEKYSAARLFDRQSGLDGAEPGVTGYTLVLSARLMMLVSAPTIESPVTTL